MGFVPIFFRVDGRPCLVVGGGEVAARKAKLLIEAGAALTIISPRLAPSLVHHVSSGQARHIARAYREGDMRGYAIVYAAVGDREVAAALFDEAQRLGVPINVADEPNFCNFIVPAVVRRGKLQVAISTAGASPALAARLKGRIEAALGIDLEAMVEVLGAARAWLRRNEGDPEIRAQKLRALAGRALEEALSAGDARAVEAELERCLGAPVALADLGLERGGLFAAGSASRKAAAR